MTATKFWPYSSHRHTMHVDKARTGRRKTENANDYTNESLVNFSKQNYNDDLQLQHGIELTRQLMPLFHRRTYELLVSIFYYKNGHRPNVRLSRVAAPAMSRRLVSMHA
jgi:hypothetical protein